MSKIKFMRVLLVIISVLIIIGVILMCWMLATADDRTVLKVDLDIGDAAGLVFEDLCLVPGGENLYTIQLNSNKRSVYKMHLDFVESEEHTLKKYARVRITSQGQELYDALLLDAFEDSNIVIPVSFPENKNTRLEILFYLPIDVGNEAENADAVFELLITASNE